MVVMGLKFWHGDMSAKEVFPLSNPFSQSYGAAQGICTASSLAWARACLKRGRAVSTWDEVGVGFHALNIQMATLRRYDNDPQTQTEMAGLELVTEPAVGSVDDVIRKVAMTKPFTAIFWTAEHTMGYRYSHHEKEFFDIETGLWRAKYTAGIRAKMNEIVGRYGPVVGCRIVKLP